MTRLVATVVALVLLSPACSSGKAERPGAAAGPSSSSSTTATTSTASTTSSVATDSAQSAGGIPAAGVLVIGSRGATLAGRPGGAVTGRLRGDVTVAYDAVEGGWARVVTPCENRAWLRLGSGRVLRSARVVIDPGHGGNEPGAVGPTGLTEAEVNLDVARRVVEDLRDQDIEAILTRRLDYRVTLGSRVAIARALQPAAFVSIHHNAEPDGPRDGPGTETYYQYRSPESKRLAGLVYEEVVKTLSTFSASWVGDTDAGAKWRVNDAGIDYYGLMRRAGEAGVVASLAELAFVSNPTEEALLRRADVRRAEAAAVSRGIVRYLRTSDPGSGFTVPYPRKEPAGPGGGTVGCVEPSN